MRQVSYQSANDLQAQAEHIGPPWTTTQYNGTGTPE
jgi:hypothetical protein